MVSTPPIVGDAQAYTYVLELAPHPTQDTTATDTLYWYSTSTL